MPRKIVPSTRKLSPRGGISTKVTRSAIAESRPSLNHLFSRASTHATAPPTSMDNTIFSSMARPTNSSLA